METPTAMASEGLWDLMPSISWTDLVVDYRQGGPQPLAAVEIKRTGVLPVQRWTNAFWRGVISAWIMPKLTRCM